MLLALRSSNLLYKPLTHVMLKKISQAIETFHEQLDGFMSAQGILKMIKEIDAMSQISGYSILVTRIQWKCWEEEGKGGEGRCVFVESYIYIQIHEKYI